MKYRRSSWFYAHAPWLCRFVLRPRNGLFGREVCKNESSSSSPPSSKVKGCKAVALATILARPAWVAAALSSSASKTPLLPTTSSLQDNLTPGQQPFSRAPRNLCSDLKLQKHSSGPRGIFPRALYVRFTSHLAGRAWTSTSTSTTPPHHLDQHSIPTLLVLRHSLNPLHFQTTGKYSILKMDHQGMPILFYISSSTRLRPARVDPIHLAGTSLDMRSV